MEVLRSAVQFQQRPAIVAAGQRFRCGARPAIRSPGLGLIAAAGGAVVRPLLAAREHTSVLLPFPKQISRPPGCQPGLMPQARGFLGPRRCSRQRHSAGRCRRVRAACGPVCGARGRVCGRPVCHLAAPRHLGAPVPLPPRQASSCVGSRGRSICSIASPLCKGCTRLAITCTLPFLHPVLLLPPPLQGAAVCFGGCAGVGAAGQRAARGAAVPPRPGAPLRGLHRQHAALG